MHIIMLPVIPDYPCLYPYLLASTPTSLPLPLPPCLYPCPYYPSCPYYLLASSPVLTTSLPLPLSLLPIYASSPLPLSLLSFLPLCHLPFLLTASPIHHRFLVYLGDLCVSKGQPLQQVQMMVCKIVLEEPYCDVLIRIRYGLPATPVH